jgi:hypothetical protein
MRFAPLLMLGSFSIFWQPEHETRSWAQMTETKPEPLAPRGSTWLSAGRPFGR